MSDIVDRLRAAAETSADRYTVLKAVAEVERLRAALVAVREELESPSRNTVRGNPHGFAVIISSETRERVRSALSS
jgi:hypothetical protein